MKERKSGNFSDEGVHVYKKVDDERFADICKFKAKLWIYCKDLKGKIQGKPEVLKTRNSRMCQDCIYIEPLTE